MTISPLTAALLSPVAIAAALWFSWWLGLPLSDHRLSPWSKPKEPPCK